MTAFFRNSADVSDVALQPATAEILPARRKLLRHLAEEVPVAMVFDGTSAGVMMASPSDIRDLAFGFALTEGIISDLTEIKAFEEVATNAGIEARIWLKRERSAALAKRRRLMAGPVGCGLCGIDSLEQAARRLSSVDASGMKLTFEMVSRASEALRSCQPLHDQTGSTHAAGFLTAENGIVMAREDVGRHNALDKLIGALAVDGISPASGAFVMTSRISVELVQKCAVAGCGVIIAISAPTSYAVQSAAEAGITLAAFARGNDFELFTHPHRIEK